jgi:RimJ/RimL family protein N-acetyltransferase
MAVVSASMIEDKASVNIEAITPFPIDRLDSLWEWICAARKQVADDFGPQTWDEFVDSELERVTVAASGNVATFAIYRNGELGGYVRAERTGPITCDAHCIFARDFYGYQTTIPALNKVAGQLFEAGIQRITLSTLAHNTPVRALLKRLGAVEEGRLREATLQDGQPVDVLIFGLLRHEWESKQQAPTSEK